MRHPAWLIAVFACTGVAAADQLQALLPLPLAARVKAGPAGDGAVVLEPFDSQRVRVTVEMRPERGLWLWAEGRQAGLIPCPSVEACQVEVELPLPAELAASRGLGPAARLWRVVSWVSRWVQAAEDDSGAQDAASVLQRRRGRCSGRANLAVALLRQLGVPARPVHGLLFRLGGPSWHRWAEAWLPGLGWRPFDPGLAVGAVSVRYLPMNGAEERLPLTGVRLLHVEEGAFNTLPRVWGLRVVPHWPAWRPALFREDL